MVRVIGLILVLATVAANVAHADDRLESGAAKAVGTVGHHRPGDASASRVRLQIGGGGLVFVPTGRDTGLRADFLDLVGAEPGRGWQDRSLTSDSGITYGRSEDGPNFGASSQPGLAYSVNNALSLGLDYRYQSRETVNFKVAKVGGLEPDYHSHNFMFEARLEF
jgi:opacity protein-like surface antigen